MTSIHRSAARPGPRSRRRWASAALAGVVVCAPVALVSSGAATAAGGSNVVTYRFDAGGAAGAKQAEFSSGGSGRVSAAVVTANDGMVRSVASRATQGAAVQFPSFDATADGPHAVIKVVNATSTDDMAPLRRDFSWSADFRLAATSSSHADHSHDNGDNLLQRGLYDDAQFKLDVDGRRPGCRLRGSTGGAGAVRVVAPVTVDSSSWYSATCSRAGDRLRIRVSRFGPGGAVQQTWTRTARSAAGFGTVRWSNVHTPLAIGGKLSERGRIVMRATDQFNGVVDNVRLRFGG
jgi:hypothetical protein